MNTILAILAKPTTAVDAFRPIDEYAKEVLNQSLTTKVCSIYIIRMMQFSKASYWFAVSSYHLSDITVQMPLCLTRAPTHKFHITPKGIWYTL